jgi:hypothetical protein
MALADIYVQSYGQLAEFFRKPQDGQAPDRFTQQHLKDLGFSSSSHRTFIPLLKALGFLTDDGTPTPRYHEYRNRAHARGVLGQALRDAYGDLFIIKERPTDADRDLIEGKFKSTHNVGDRPAELMAKTFYALLNLADLEHTKPKPTKEELKPKEEKEPAAQEKTNQALPPSLHYNIQIHLPATKDIEVFNAIFKSLKEHLLE